MIKWRSSIATFCAWPFIEYLMQKRTTPIPVIVNEAVHLAQLFGAEHSHSFVHGVLGAITNELEPEAQC